MMDSDSEFEDMSWLTQKETKKDVANFQIIESSDDEDQDGITVNNDSNVDVVSDGNLVDLEENVAPKHQLLYDNVFAENISSDEEIDEM